MSTSNRQEAAFCSLIPRSRQREVSLVVIAGILCAAGLALGADLSQAVVRQKVNVVTLAPNLTGEAHPAAQGAVIHDENVVRTGRNLAPNSSLPISPSPAWAPIRSSLSTQRRGR